jgi:hypothetical protein
LGVKLTLERGVFGVGNRFPFQSSITAINIAEISARRIQQELLDSWRRHEKSLLLKGESVNMQMQTRKRITTTKPVKAWKIITNVSPNWWNTGYWVGARLLVGGWMSSPVNTPGFHAFKSRQAATNGLYEAVKDGIVKNPAYVVPCYLKGTVEFGIYKLNGLKAVRGSHMLIKTKHMPRGYYDQEDNDYDSI